MKYPPLKPSLLAVSVMLAASVQAADTRINGFASIVAGKTFSEGTNNSTFTADNPTEGAYDDDLSFKPDSIFGLQVSSDLGDGLSVTGQFTGTGGEDFDATVSWAYVSYALNDSWTVVAGRQRIPFFFYSDFLDVAYAYHWARPPVEASVPLDILDGIQLRHESNIGDWDTRVQIFGGTSDNDDWGEDLEVEGIGLTDAIGVVTYANNDWLQLRAIYMDADFYVISDNANNTQDKDNPVDVYFAGVAAHMTFGNAFVVTEYVTYEFDDTVAALGWDNYEGAYISAGYRIGSVTPHITFSTSTLETNIDSSGSFDVSTDSITLGARWDFHPKAALKIEYLTRSDDSDRKFTNIFGDLNEVDLLTVGVDVIF